MANERYETAKIAVDPVIFTIHNRTLKVLLHTREKEPFLGMKELPGGLLLQGETAEESVRRKLKQLTGYEHLYVKQFNTFTEPHRDPRERVVSIGFLSLINDNKIKELATWHNVDEIDQLAFDHKKILEAARARLQKDVDSSIVKHFMPKRFPLNALQEVYEILEGKKYDNRNFRKRVITAGIVQETDQVEQSVSHRPALLFQF